MPSMADPKPTLDYAGPKPEAVEPPPQLPYAIPEQQYSQGLALLLCAPGAASFALFFGAMSSSIIGSALGSLFWPLWFLAVMTALASLCIYVRLPFKALPWYVVVNLVINISGLLFSLLMFRPFL